MPCCPVARESLLPTDSQLEYTIEAPLSFSGVGLHSGAPVNLRLVPAPAGSGIVFRRADLDHYEIPAGYDFDMPAECESRTPEDVVLADSGGCAV